MLLQFSTQFPQIIIDLSLTAASINRSCQFHRRRSSPLLTAQARRSGSPLALAKTPILLLSFLSPAPFCLSPRLRRPSCPRHAQRRHDARRSTCFASLDIDSRHIAGADAHCSPRAGLNRPSPPRPPAPLGGVTPLRAGRVPPTRPRITSTAPPACASWQARGVPSYIVKPIID